MKRILIILGLMLLSCQSNSAYAKMAPEAHTLYQEACQLEYQRNYSDAVAKIYEAIKVNGDDAILYTKLAGLYTDLGDNQNALAAYKKAIKLRPNDAFIYISIGNILQNINDYDNAYKAYMQAMEIFPNYKYNYYNIANVQFLQGNYTAAIDNYNLFLSAYPDHYEARENLANSYLRNNQFDKAIDEFGLLYTKNASIFKEHASYAYALFKQKQYDTAIEMFNLALQQNPDNISVMANLAVCYQEVGKNSQAKEMYERVFALKPDYAFLRLGYANLLTSMKFYDLAVNEYNTYIKAYPEDINAYTKLGLCYKTNKKFDDAISTFNIALAKDNTAVDVKRALGESYHAKADYANALRCYDEVLEYGENRAVLANKALALHAMKRYDEAITLYFDLLAEKPNKRLEANLIQALCTKGDLMLVKAQFKDALAYFDRALEVDVNSAPAYFGLAKSYDSLGIKEKAEENYKKAIELSPKNVAYETAYDAFKQAVLADALNSAAQKTVPVKNTATAPKTPAAPVVKPQLSDNLDALMINNKTGETADRGKLLIKEGDDLYKQTRFDEALTKYTEALKLNPNDATTAFKIGNLYKMSNELDNAVTYYKKAVSINKNYADAWFNLGLSYATQDNLKASRDCFDKVIALNPNYAYAHYAMALSYEKDGNVEKALQYYKSYYNLEKDENTKRAISNKINKLEQ